MILAVAALAAAPLAGGSGASATHPAAFSYLKVAAQDGVLRLELRMQELTLREVPRWWLDTDSDGRISTVEIAEAWPQVSELLADRFWLELDGRPIRPAWQMHSIEETGDPRPSGGSWFEWFTVAAEVPLPAAAALAIHSDLFVEDGNPEHRMLVLVEGVWGRPAQVLLDYATRDWSFALPTRFGTLRQYSALGFDHVLEGWDHLAFLAALLLGVAGFGPLLGAITAFTLAHSLTLALAAFGLLSLSPAAVEPAIALSVLVVALLHLRLGAARARAWLPAFAFGLLHGLGFAGVLGEIGLPPNEEAIGLLGFNLGVEGGQLAFVAPLAAAGALLRRWRPAATAGVRHAAGLAVLAFAMHLSGAAAGSWWLPAGAAGGVWRDAALGALAAVAAALPIALSFRATPGSPPLRSCVAQAALLAACYAGGSWLSGLRG